LTPVAMAWLTPSEKGTRGAQQRWEVMRNRDGAPHQKQGRGNGGPRGSLGVNAIRNGWVKRRKRKHNNTVSLLVSGHGWKLP